VEGSGRGLTLRHYLCVFLDRLRKTTKHLSGQPVSQQISEPGTSRVLSRSVNHSNTTFSIQQYRRKNLLQKQTQSSWLEPMTVFRGCGLCFCNLLFEANNFWPWRPSSIMREFPTTWTTLTETSTQKIFFEFWPCMPCVVQTGLTVLDL
jgi:hypothetical protein